MSEKENLQVVEQLIAAMNDRDVDRYVQLLDANYVGEGGLAGPIQGPEGARQMINMLLTAFPDLRPEVEQLLPSGDYVVLRARLSGTQKGNFLGIAPTNKSATWRLCSVMEIRNGKVVRATGYPDTASLMEQLEVISIPRAAAAR
jgi:predicted ester cyclase